MGTVGAGVSRVGGDVRLRGIVKGSADDRVGKGLWADGAAAVGAAGGGVVNRAFFVGGRV